MATAAPSYVDLANNLWQVGLLLLALPPSIRWTGLEEQDSWCSAACTGRAQLVTRPPSSLLARLEPSYSRTPPSKLCVP